MANKFLGKFTNFDLIMIALLSAAGVATKPFVRLLSQMLAGTIIPAGSLGGIFYMLWIVLACSITKQRGTAILVGIVQSVLVVVFDMLGNKGLANLLVYIVPGITLEIVMLLFPRYVASYFSGFIAGLTANVTGALIMGVVFMRLPLAPLMVSAGLSAVTGGLGGLVAFKLFVLVRRFEQ